MVLLVIVLRTPRRRARRQVVRRRRGETQGLGFNIRRLTIPPRLRDTRAVLQTEVPRLPAKHHPVLHQSFRQLPGQHAKPPVHAARSVHSLERFERVDGLDTLADVRAHGVDVLATRHAKEPRRALGIQRRAQLLRVQSRQRRRRKAAFVRRAPPAAPHARPVTTHLLQHHLHLLPELTPEALDGTHRERFHHLRHRPVTHRGLFVRLVSRRRQLCEHLVVRDAAGHGEARALEHGVAELGAYVRADRESPVVFAGRRCQFNHRPGRRDSGSDHLFDGDV